MTRRTLKWVTLGSTMTLLPVVLVAASQPDANGLHVFAPGDKILSAEVNQNFDVLVGREQELSDRIGVYEGAVSVGENGNVGIGTTEPGSLTGDVRVLTVSAGGSGEAGVGTIEIQGSRTSGPNTVGKIAFFSESNQVGAIRAGRDSSGPDSGFLRFSSMSSGVESPRLTIESNGNIGIGTTSPAYKLEVAGNISSSQGVIAQTLWTGDGSTGSLRKLSAGIPLHFRNSAGSPEMTIDSVGNVGIGTTTPNYTLEVNGTFHAKTVSVMADVTADDYLFNSDARLKTDILPLENASEGIACLQGVTYRWSDPQASQALQLGLIAQEVERCFPEVVTTDPRGYKSVSYARLVAPLIENAKEQQQVSELQQRTLAAQQQQLAAQAHELARLKSEQAATNARLARLEVLLNARR